MCCWVTLAMWWFPSSPCTLALVGVALSCVPQCLIVVRYCWCCRAYLEYSVRRHGRIHISSKSKKQKTRLVITPIDANVPTPRDVKRQHSVSSRRRRQRSEDSDGPPSLAELSLRTMAQESLERAAEANGFKTPVRKAPRTLGRMPQQRPLSRVDVDGFEVCVCVCVCVCVGCPLFTCRPCTCDPANLLPQLIVYQPNSFMALRNAAGLKGSHIAASLSPNAFRASELKAHFSEGASSSFFCRSKDERFVLKTAEQSEVQTLLKMLPAYIACVLVCVCGRVPVMCTQRECSCLSLLLSLLQPLVGAPAVVAGALLRLLCHQSSARWHTLLCSHGTFSQPSRLRRFVTDGRCVCEPPGQRDAHADQDDGDVRPEVQHHGPSCAAGGAAQVQDATPNTSAEGLGLP